MELTNEFRVSAPIERAFEVFQDAEVLAPCMPGAQLLEVEGDVYHGAVKVKVGPITAQYKGTAIYTTVDEAARRIVVTAQGRETRGQGNANATVTAEMVADGDGTAVRVVTDLTITGRVAQFGRGVLADVSARLLSQFVECLEASVLAAVHIDAAAGGAHGSGSAEPVGAGSGGPGRPAGAQGNGAAGPGQQPRVRAVEHREVEPIDLLEVAGAPVARRIVPLVVGLLSAMFLLRRRRKRRNRRRNAGSVGPEES